MHFLCYPCKLVIHGPVDRRWSEKQRADIANKAEHFHQEAALTQAGEAKEHGKGGELSKFLSLCPAWHRTSKHWWFRGSAFLFKKDRQIDRRKEALFAVCVRYRDKYAHQRFHWYYAPQQAAFPLHSRCINNRRLTGPCISLPLYLLLLLNSREPQLSAIGFSKEHGRIFKGTQQSHICKQSMQMQDQDQWQQFQQFPFHQLKTTLMEREIPH